MTPIINKNNRVFILEDNHPNYTQKIKAMNELTEQDYKYIIFLCILRQNERSLLMGDMKKFDAYIEPLKDDIKIANDMQEKIQTILNTF